MSSTDLTKGCKPGSILKTLKKNWLRMFPCLRPHATYVEDVEFASQKQINVFLLSRLLTHATLWATLKTRKHCCRRKIASRTQKNVLENFNFLLSRCRFCVFNLCCVGMQTRKHLQNTEETLTFLFPCLRIPNPSNIYWRHSICVWEVKNVLLLSRLLTHATL